MAGHATFTLTYTPQLVATNAAGKVSVYSRDNGFWLVPTTAVAVPTSTANGIFVPPGLEGGSLINLTLAEMFPGMPTAAHLYAFIEQGGKTANALVSYA